jgi:hypothetical protein
MPVDRCKNVERFRFDSAMVGEQSDKKASG